MTSASETPITGPLHLTLYGRKKTLTLFFSETEARAYCSRLNRYFLFRVSEEKLQREIRATTTCSALEELSRRYDLADVTDFSDLNVQAVQGLLRVMVHCLYRFPKLRGRLGFVGSPFGLLRLLTRFRDEEGLKKLGLFFIPAKQRNQVNSFLFREGETLVKDRENYIACYLSMFDLFQAVIVDDENYQGGRFAQLLIALENDERSHFHPVGSSNPDYVIYHELGHALADQAGLLSDASFRLFYSSLKKEKIRENLSEYALVNEQEFIAEAFAEYCTNPTPRSYALSVGQMIEKRCQRHP